ncbi:MAG: GNAT family N-acetyltransferase [Myxococcota bacterium]|nr:GNAT family N-acetyltransferase [Myxococcota bacterium]
MKELRPHDRERLIHFLRGNATTNIFLLSVLDRSESNHSQLAAEGQFFVPDGADELRAVVYVTRGGLCVPFSPDPADLRLLARSLRTAVRPRLLVGPRAETDVLWDELQFRASARLYRRHRLYRLLPGELSVEGHPDVRLATARDLDKATHFAARMQSEELGLDPRQVDQTRFRRRIARLIANEQFYILPQGETHAFQASASAQCVEGAQVEAVFVPPALRGRGWGRRGLAGMCKVLLQRFPMVTLHVNEENHPAVRVYERLGFVPDAAFRLISL